MTELAYANHVQAQFIHQSYLRLNIAIIDRSFSIEINKNKPDRAHVVLQR